jgi:hypothetical protein
VDAHVSKRKYVSGIGEGRLAPGQDRLDAGREHLRVEGLGDVVVRPEVEAPQLVLVVVLDCEHNHRGVHPGLPRLPQHFKPVLLRQSHVEEHEIVGGEGRHLLEGILALHGVMHLVAVLGKERLQAASQVRIVLRNEEPGLRGPCRTTGERHDCACGLRELQVE